MEHYLFGPRRIISKKLPQSPLRFTANVKTWREVRLVESPNAIKAYFDQAPPEILKSDLAGVYSFAINLAEMSGQRAANYHHAEQLFRDCQVIRSLPKRVREIKNPLFLFCGSVFAREASGQIGVVAIVVDENWKNARFRIMDIRKMSDKDFVYTPVVVSVR